MHRGDEWLDRNLAAWVDVVVHHVRPILLGISIVTIVAGLYTASSLSINSDNVKLVPEDLPSRQNYEAFIAEFPNLENALLVVIDGETPELARAAADELWTALSGQPDRYRDVYLPGGGTFFEENGLLYRSADDLDDFADQMAKFQPILAELERDASIAQLASLVQQGLEQDAEPEFETTWPAILDQISEATVSLYREYPLAVSWESILLQGSPIDVVTRRVIVVDPILDFGSAFAAGTAVRSIRDAARELNLVPERGIRIRITGNPALNYEEMYNVVRDVLYAGAFCFALVVLILLVALRSLALVVASLVCLLVGLVWTAGFATLAIGELNLVSMTFAVLFIGLGVDFAIHLCMGYGHQLHQGLPVADALRSTTAGVGSSLAICAVTTAVGFYVFVPTDYRGVAELGLIAGTGMFVILFLTLTLLPALLSSWIRVDVHSLHDAVHFRRKWWSIFDRNPSAVRIAALLIAIASCLVVPQLRFDPNVVAMRDPTTESVRAFDDLLAESGTASPWFVNSIADDLPEAQALALRMDALASVSQTLTLADYVPEDQEEKLLILEDVQFLLDTPPIIATGDEVAMSDEAQIVALRELHTHLVEMSTRDRADDVLHRSIVNLAGHLERFLEDLESSGDPEEALASLESVLLSGFPDQIARLRSAIHAPEITLDRLPAQLVRRMRTADGRARVQIFPAENLGNEAAFERFAREVMSVDPAAAGVSINLVEFASAIKRSFFQALASALVVIALFLWLLWRRADLVALAMTPVLLSSLSTAGFMAVTGIPFNFANVVVIPLLMGIGVDSGIHLVHRWLATPHGEDLLRSSTARAVLYSAFTTIVSFGSLAFSSHRGLANMGTVLSVGMAITIVSNLIVLPALLQLRSRHHRVEAPPPPAVE